MKKALTLVALIGLAAPAISQVEAVEADMVKEKPAVLALGGKIPANVALKTLDGKEQKLVAADKITVVNFWSITCPIMAGWEERMTAIYKKYEEQGVEFRFINPNAPEFADGEVSAEDVEDGVKPYRAIRNFLKEKKLPYTVMLDTGNVITDRFQARTTPHIFVFDKSASLVYSGLIDDDPRNVKGDAADRYLVNTLDALLEGEKLEPRQTLSYGCAIVRAKPRTRGSR